MGSCTIRHGNINDLAHTQTLGALEGTVPASQASGQHCCTIELSIAAGGGYCDDLETRKGLRACSAVERTIVRKGLALAYQAVSSRLCPC